MKGLDYKWLEALNEVMAQQGFEPAAEKLFISQSAVSQRIKQLEKYVAQPVLVREQPLRLTPVGKKLIGLYRKVCVLEEELLPELKNEPVTTPVTLSIAANADALATWLLPSLSGVMKSGKVELDINILTEFRAAEKLKNGEVSGAISQEKDPMPGCVSEYLGRIDYLCVASPAFIQLYLTEGVTAQSLMKVPAVRFDQYDTMYKEFLMTHFGAFDGNNVCHTVRSSEAFVRLALEGMAYCLIPQIQIEKELADGRLIDITPGKTYSYPIYWHHWQLESGVLRDVTQAITGFTRSHLPQ
ncbi:LysR family transcriptional regulator ArgP [Vibrio salinus]|uniref:LysR family transcriptional regulator ArgP n=1 Tax=Vibrio salinus TaxID=2899784 RepID=UPI001E49E773|nr:LysR family transcriptional regulator ArgP [Vibrio salinus]MCE0494149.1 LysR family transcriptional regulator ArgP [Vibrio salinus]